MKNFFNFFLLLLSISFSSSKTPYDDLLEWGKNNSLYISDNIGMKYINENNKTYYAKDDIAENTLIMNIPYDLMLNREKAFKLLDNKKLEKLYLDYKSQKFGIDIGFLPASLEQSFLAYILTYYTTHPKKYKKTKFYSYFHYLIDTFETDLDSYPVFYSQSQLKLLTGSLALIETTLLKELYNEEANKLKRLGGGKIDIDEFMRYRTLTTVKTLNITNNTSIVPFIDMFENDPIDYNINFKLNETTRDLYVFTTKPIRRDSTLYIRSGHFSNNKRFVIYGQTFEKMKDYIEAFQIPMISYKLQQQIKVEDENFEYEESIDLVKKKFYKKALGTYKQLSKYNKEDGSDISAYKLFLKNLEMSREAYNDVSSSDVYREFVKAKDINNVIRVLNFEKKFMDEKIEVLKKYIHKLEKNEKREKKYEKNINKDL